MKVNKILIGLISFYSSLSFGLCNFNYAFSPIFVTSSSNNLDSVQSISVSRPSNTNSQNCGEAYTFFSKGSANSYSRKALNSFGESIDYNLYRSSNKNTVLKDFQDFQNSNEYLSTYLNYPNSLVISQFYFYLPAQNSTTMVRGGTYNDTITLNIFRGGIGSPFGYFELARSLPITIVVPKLVNLALVDTGAPIDLNSTNKILDFGTLESNEEKSFDLMIASNAGYRISLSSLNNGNLKKVSGNELISYSLKVSGSTISLNNSATTPVQIATGSGITGNSGVRIPLNVKIGDITNTSFGDYQDYITITAATND